MKFKIIFFTLFALFIFSSRVNAQLNFPTNCDACEKTDSLCQQVSGQNCIKILERCVQLCEEKAQKLEEEIKRLGKTQKTLSDEISILRKRIEKLNSEISQTNLLISQTVIQITETEKSIQKTLKSIEEEKERMAEILRLIHALEEKSFIEILISEPTLSNFFDNISYLEFLNEKSKEVLDTIKALNLSLETQKNILEDEKERNEKLLKMHILQKKENEEITKKKNELLGQTKAEAEKYAKEKEETKRLASEIRKRIFELVGITKPPTFGEAVEIAKYVESVLGIRPAFLLAVLTQESNLGKNVGQCYLKDVNAGTGIKISTGETIPRVMAPGPPYSTRNDVAIFLALTRELGRDPFSTPVSCPMSFGWGGAMGPAQFLPTTWRNYEGRLSAIIGRKPDPWNIRDAFLAAGLYLRDFGAGSQNREDERRAALYYFSGSTNPAFSWYANSVLAIADRYEEDIRILKGG